MPSDVRRFHRPYSVCGRADRGGRAHKDRSQLVIAMSCGLEIVIEDGTVRRRLHLNCSYPGLCIYPTSSGELDAFSFGTVCRALVSNVYNEGDDHRGYDDDIRVLVR